MNEANLNIYLVSNGNVTFVADAAQPDAAYETEVDGWDCVLVAATSELEAQYLSEAYDNEEVELGNISYCGKTLACVAKTFTTT